MLTFKLRSIGTHESEVHDALGDGLARRVHVHVHLGGAAATSAGNQARGRAGGGGQFECPIVTHLVGHLFVGL